MPFAHDFSRIQYVKIFGNTDLLLRIQILSRPNFFRSRFIISFKLNDHNNHWRQTAQNTFHSQLNWEGKEISRTVLTERKCFHKDQKEKDSYGSIENRGKRHETTTNFKTKCYVHIPSSSSLRIGMRYTWRQPSHCSIGYRWGSFCGRSNLDGWTTDNLSAKKI